MKKIIIVLIVATIIIVTISFMNISHEEDSSTTKAQNSLSIMVYDLDKNDYVPQSVFPIGYTLNTEKSYCDNGSSLGIYDSENGIIITNPTQSDKCYYYFDKIKKPTIESLEDLTTDLYSYKISVVTSGGTEPLTFHYKLYNEVLCEFQIIEGTSNSNIITITGEHHSPVVNNDYVEIYVVDANGNKSETSTLNFKTCEEYAGSPMACNLPERC